VRIQPICYLQNSQDPFLYPDAAQTVYVDTTPPECPTDLYCSLDNPRIADFACQWTTPDDPNVHHVASWDLRYTADATDQTDCTADALLANWQGLDTVPGSEQLAGADYGSQQSETFQPFAPGQHYCMGARVIDDAGNESDCVAPLWLGQVDIRQSWFSPCSSGDAPCSFGRAVAGADVNCDGYADLIVGAPDRNLDSAGTGEGTVHIYFGGPNGINANADPDVSILGTLGSNGLLGASLAGLGNFTGHSGQDGACEDFAVGAPSYDYPHNGKLGGTVFVIRGHPNWNATISENDADLVINYVDPDPSGHGFESIGERISNLGDVNGDGVPDLGIGVPFAGSTGSVFVLYGRDVPYQSGSPEVWTLPADGNLRINGDSIFANDWSKVCLDYIGSDLSPAGDLDGDGLGDFLIGAPGTEDRWTLNCDPSDLREGKAYIVFGTQATTTDHETLDATAPGTRITTITADSGSNIANLRSVGSAVSGLGDINGDGKLDIAVSDIHYGGDTGGATDYYGALFVFFGDSQGFRGDGRVIEADDADLWIRSNGSPDDKFGMTIASGVQVAGRPLGDFDGDSLADLVVGTERFGAYDGSIWFLYGSTGLASLHAWVDWNTASFFMPPPAPCGRWGFVISYLGDTNLDGYVDLAVGDDQFPRVCNQNDDSRGRVAVLY
ncbi:MAG: FG-GAP repeat protein, partial [Deltaproteobacteria bacterium]|nr:FG-GAP repeat protein [Deltaproteobacteria bacterium]